MNRIRAFGHFWYDFIVGDDWRLAAAAAVALGVTAIVAHADATAWWLTPLIVVGVIGTVVGRARPRV